MLAFVGAETQRDVVIGIAQVELEKTLGHGALGIVESHRHRSAQRQARHAHNLDGARGLQRVNALIELDDRHMGVTQDHADGGRILAPAGEPERPLPEEDGKLATGETLGSAAVVLESYVSFDRDEVADVQAQIGAEELQDVAGVKYDVERVTANCDGLVDRIGRGVHPQTQRPAHTYAGGID